MTLFINACVRRESRTRLLADHLLSAQKKAYEEVYLPSIPFPPVDEAFLLARDRLIQGGEFDAPMFELARQFARADEIVIAAPFWDLSFPSSLKQYFEQINVVGITFVYTPEGVPKGLCRAKRLTYVTTAGGGFLPEEYGFGYIQALARSFYGIEEVKLIKAVGLDVDGADVDAVMKSAMEEIDALVSSRG